MGNNAFLLRVAAVGLFLLAPVRHVLADDRLAIGPGEGRPGARAVMVPVTARHDLAIHGFSLSISYPRAVLRLIEVTPQGTAVSEVGTDFFQEELDDPAGTVVLGAIFSFREPRLTAELPPTSPTDRPQLIAWLIFDVLDDAAPGEHRIRLLDGLGDPPISNRFTHRGATIRPALEDGSFLVQSENVLTLESKFAIQGSRIGTLYAYARHPEPLQGYQVAVTFDHRALFLEDATFTGTSMYTSLGGLGKIEFYKLSTRAEELVSPTESRTTVGIIFDYLEPYNDRQSLPPETGSSASQSIMKYSFQVRGGPEEFGESIPLKLGDSTAPEAINNAFIIRGDSIVPRKHDGGIYFSTGFLAGKVIDLLTGRPIAGAAVLTEPGDHAGSTRPDGAFTIGGLDGIPPGSYSLSISKAGYLPGRARGQVAGLGATGDVGEFLLFPVPRIVGGFRRGRINQDALLDLSDGILLLGYLFLGSETPGCLDSADVNDDGRLNLTDPIALFGYLFIGGLSPPSPFAVCGPDRSEDALDCRSAPGCQ